MNDNRDKQLIVHIIQHCDEITEELKQVGSKKDFYSNIIHQKSTCFSVLQIGELVRKLSDDTKNRFNEIPWRAISSMRNKIVHDYGDVDLNTVWKTVCEDIPELKDKCDEIITKLEYQTQNHHESKDYYEIFCETHSGDHIQNEALRQDWQKCLPEIAKSAMKFTDEKVREEVFLDKMKRWLREKYSYDEVAEAFHEAGYGEDDTPQPSKLR